MILKKEMNKTDIFKNKYISKHELSGEIAFVSFYDFNEKNNGIITTYFSHDNVIQQSFDYEIHNNILILRKTLSLSQTIPIICVFEIIDYYTLNLQKTYKFKCEKNDLNYFSSLSFDYFRDDVLNEKKENDYIEMTQNNLQEEYILKTSKEIEKIKSKIDKDKKTLRANYGI